MSTGLLYNAAAFWQHSSRQPSHQELVLLERSTVTGGVSAFLVPLFFYYSWNWAISPRLSLTRTMSLSAAADSSSDLVQSLFICLILCVFKRVIYQICSLCSVSLIQTQFSPARKHSGSEPESHMDGFSLTPPDRHGNYAMEQALAAVIKCKITQRAPLIFACV